MGVQYILYTLQTRDCLMELKRILLPYSTAPQVSVWIAEVDRLNKKLETMHFQVAVVGEFKRGKTSFINALLRKQILPADVVPATATINRITYGNVPSSYIQWKDGRPDEKIEIERLADYITKLTASSAILAQDIKEAVVRYPCRFCENNVDLIDTPGMNDDDVMNNVTIQQLSNIDLAIVILDPGAPVSNTEACFVAQLVENEQICKIVFVVSKMDTVFGSQRERLLETIRQRLKDHVREVLLKTHTDGDEVMEKYYALFSEIILFPVSSVQALYAYEIGDQQILEGSGFQKLNDELLPLIIQTQHSAAVLTTLQAVIRISHAFGQLLKRWEERTAEEAALREMKTSFAETAYQKCLDYEQSWQVCVSALQQQKETRCRAVYDSLIGAMRQTRDRLTLLNHVKEIFQQLNVELPKEEQMFCLQFRDQVAAPAYRQLKLYLIKLVQPNADIFGQIVSYLDELDRFESPPAQAAGPFYWETFPVPPESMRQGQIAYFVDNAVRASFENYYQRRGVALSRYMQDILKDKEQQIVRLVQTFFYIVRMEKDNGITLPVEQSVYIRIEEDLKQLVQQCNTVRDDYRERSNCEE